MCIWDFPGGPVVKTPSSQGSIPGRGRSCMPRGWPKKKKIYVYFMVVNDKIDKSTYILCIWDIPKFFLNFLDISMLWGASASFFKLSHISKKFSSVCVYTNVHTHTDIYKNPHICGPARFQPLLFKGQLYLELNGITILFKIMEIIEFLFQFMK